MVEPICGQIIRVQARFPSVCRTGGVRVADRKPRDKVRFSQSGVACAGQAVSKNVANEAMHISLPELSRIADFSQENSMLEAVVKRNHAAYDAPPAPSSTRGALWPVRALPGEADPFVHCALGVQREGSLGVIVWERLASRRQFYETPCSCSIAAAAKGTA